jgi:hypothetical protein
MKTATTTRSISPDLKNEVKEALADWVGAMSPDEANKKLIFFADTGYSPLQIKKEVEQETPFGTYFLTGLCELNERMLRENPKASIVELIRESVKQINS